MSLDLSPRLMLARITAVLTDLDTGASNARLLMFTAPKPVAGGAQGAATKLVDQELANPSGTITNNILSLTPIAGGPPLVLANGNIFWARLVDGNGDWVIDMTVTDNTGTGPVKVDTLTVLAGGTVTVLSANLQ